MKKRTIFIIFLLSLILQPPILSGVAQEDVPFMVQPIFPENQHKDVKGYYKLNVEPGQQQKIFIKVINNLNKEQKLLIEAVNAYSNPNGGMIYQKNVDSPNTRSLDDAIHLEPHVVIENEIILDPKEEREVPIEIHVPNIDTGSILGGITVKSGENDNQQSLTKKEGEANFIINTETIHAIALQLDLPNEATPNFFLGEAEFDILGPSVTVEMTNNSQRIQGGIDGSYQVKDADGQILFEGEITTFNMAPKTAINFPLHWDHETLEDGTYSITIHLNVNDEDITRTEEFTIGNDQIQEYVERTQPVVPQVEGKESIPIWVLILAGAIVLGGLLFWLGARNRKSS